MDAPALEISPDRTGFVLEHGGALLAGLPGAEERDATVTTGRPVDERPTVAVLDERTLDSPPTGASLYVVAQSALPARGRDRALRVLRRRIPRHALIAAPPSIEGAYDRSPVEVLLASPGDGPEATARHILQVGVRAAGRPVLLLVERILETDTITAAIDAGAAGAIFTSGLGERGSALLAATREAERARLRNAPLITVAICNRNGARDLEACLGSLRLVEYPRFETLVIDDGSSDDSVEVARGLGARVVELPSGGLGRARNAAIDHAAGEIIAFLDGDAEASPTWLTRLWRLHDRLRPGAVGGPNLAMPDVGWQERAIGGAPGVAMPIVAADGRATHLAGCNLSVRTNAARSAMFDPEVGSGDDVRFCYRLIDNGEDLLLSPTAVIHHHRRRTLEGYVRQMSTYGRASAQMREAHGERLVEIDEHPTLLARLDPRRPHVCFHGPQAEQRYNLANAPLSNGFPMKLMALTGSVALAGGALAWPLGHGRGWLALSGAAVLGQLGYVVARAPVQPGPGGLRGLATRIVTASLWYAGPTAVASGRIRERRASAARWGLGDA